MFLAGPLWFLCILALIFMGFFDLFWMICGLTVFNEWIPTTDASDASQAWMYLTIKDSLLSAWPVTFEEDFAAKLYNRKGWRSPQRS